MIQGTFYVIDSGEIKGLFEMPGPIFPPDEGWSWISGHWPQEDFYVVNGCPARRPRMQISIDGLLFSGLPNPATVRVGEERFTIDDGEAELKFMVPGTYQVEITAFPYQVASYEVVAP
jgi:hypothetical protein